MTEDEHKNVLRAVDQAAAESDHERIELVLLETITWLRSLDPKASRVQRIERLEIALALHRKTRPQ